MVTSSLSVKNSHTYKFTSNEDQLVTIVVTPIAELDDFDLYIYDEHGNQLAYSVKTNDYVDWVQIKVPAGKKLQAKVRLYSSGHIFFKSYRIFVTGSTSLLKEVNVTGPHINNW